MTYKVSSEGSSIGGVLLLDFLEVGEHDPAIRILLGDGQVCFVASADIVDGVSDCSQSD